MEQLEPDDVPVVETDDAAESEVEVEVEVEDVEPVAPAPEPEPVPDFAYDEVSISLEALSYSRTRRNSASVDIFQRRLAALGYASARSDLAGWFHDGTRAALAEYLSDENIDGTTEYVSEDVALRVFAGTGVVLANII